MTRINTNVTSLVAQNTLGRSNADLGQALTRLSTGLQINTGKDDPAGLIASENLRSDIASIRKAISNTDRANQVIATADSALGQVSSLLNDIRGLVTEAANTGAMSPAQIAANQLQLDSSLEALNRIAQTTTFQGRKLLDGSLAFLTEAGAGFNTVSDLKIDQANLGSTGQMAVNVTVSAAATRAEISNAGVNAPTAAEGTVAFQLAERLAANALGDAGFDDNAVAGTLTIRSTSDFAGDAGNDLTIEFQNDAARDLAESYSELNGNVLTIVVGTQDAGGATIDLDDLFDAVAAANGGNNAYNDNLEHAAVAGDYTIAADESIVLAFSGGRDEEAAEIAVTAVAGAAGNITLEFEFDDASAGTDGVLVTDNLDGTFTVTIDDSAAVSMGDIAAQIAAQIAEIDTATTDSQALVYGFGANADSAPANSALTGGTDPNTLDSAIVFEVAGASGAQVLNFGQGTSISDVVAGINAVSDATGVEANEVNGELVLTSTGYGSAAFVSVEVLEGDDNGTFANGLSAARQEGDDIVASVNGIQANGDGNTLSVNTATLNMSMTVSDGSSTDVTFTIVGGGALFQLGPDVVSNQQARVGITSVNTARLGGSNGKLFELGSGGAADLTNDLTRAARIVEEAIDQVTLLRGRLGAFQRTSLETNRNALSDTLVNLTDAESQIRDADFAAETAALTRAQILTQSGTVVLQIANQNPQNALALLR